MPPSFVTKIHPSLKACHSMVSKCYVRISICLPLGKIYLWLVSCSLLIDVYYTLPWTQRLDVLTSIYKPLLIYLDWHISGHWFFPLLPTQPWFPWQLIYNPAFFRCSILRGLFWIAGPSVCQNSKSFDLQFVILCFIDCQTHHIQISIKNELAQLALKKGATFYDSA